MAGWFVCGDQSRGLRHGSERSRQPRVDASNAVDDLHVCSGLRCSLPAGIARGCNLIVGARQPVVRRQNRQREGYLGQYLVPGHPAIVGVGYSFIARVRSAIRRPKAVASAGLSITPQTFPFIPMMTASAQSVSAGVGGTYSRRMRDRVSFDPVELSVNRRMRMFARA